MATVSRLSIAPVKGMALVHPEVIALERYGVADNRRFHLVDERGRRYGQIRDGTLVCIAPRHDARTDDLELRFPDGTVASGTVELGQAIETDFYGRAVPGRLVEGPWSEAISRYAGRALRLVKTDEPGGGVDRGHGTVTMLSDASLAELARRSGRDAVDGRRFRMLIGLADCDAHEEDAWLGRTVRVGAARVRLHEQVARCAITTQNPETGVPDFDTLRQIKDYRGLRDGDAIDFGVYGEVEQPGIVRVGDPVAPE